MDPTQFKKLKLEWYKKLAKSGFRDIENENGRMDIGKSLHNIVQKYDQNSYAEKEEYYRLAGRFLWDYPFPSKQERLIWELHSEGVAIDDIYVELKKKRMSKGRRQIWLLIRKYAVEMRTHIGKK